MGRIGDEVIQGLKDAAAQDAKTFEFLQNIQNDMTRALALFANLPLSAAQAAEVKALTEAQAQRSKALAQAAGTLAVTLDEAAPEEQPEP